VTNINLNAGGVIGAIVCGGVAGVVLFSNIDPEGPGRGPIRLAIFALIGGAFAGNFLWGLVFKKPTESATTSVPQQPDRGSSA
jgi:hypothetical protein